MPYDHSINYRRKSIKSLPHRIRLKNILLYLEKEVNFTNKTYCDVGCSNGYITALINAKFKPAECHGLDHSEGHVNEGRINYPDICFNTIDLNHDQQSFKQYDIVSCFETLEHVGNLDKALENLLNITKKEGFLFIVVPIEIGFQGLVRFVIKTSFFKYNLNELSQEEHLYRSYFLTLLRGGRISRFRDKRQGWGTHFGFDYRDIDDYLRTAEVEYRAENKCGARYYFIKHRPPRSSGSKSGK